MGRPLRIGLFSPFFGSTIGGGEKYLGVTAEAIRDGFPEHEVEIVSPVPVDRKRYQDMLRLDLEGIELVSMRGRVTPVHRLLNSVRPLRLYRDLYISAQSARFTRRYDLYLTMVYVLPPNTEARRSVILCQFPYKLGWNSPRQGAVSRRLFWVYALPYRAVRPVFVHDDLDRFAAIVTQSEYVRHWVAAYWERDSLVVNPPIDVPEEEPDWRRKRKVILSVGRFFSVGHSKRHDVLVQAFRDLCDSGLEGWELHLAGSLHRRSDDLDYYRRVEELARGYAVQLHPDASYDVIQNLYRQASIYWHAAGYGVDPARRPIDLEHFGMTTAEAMGHGSVPIVIGSGGQPEVVRDAVDGFLWRDLDELKQRTLTVAANAGLRRHLGSRAREASLRFSRQHFKRRMAEALRPIVRELEASTDSEPEPATPG